MMKKMLPVFVILLILVGGGSFYGGMKYANSKRVAAFGAQGAGGNFRGGNFGGGASGTTRGAGAGARGGFANGEIISKDDSSVTIKLASGGSQIVFFSTSTAILKAAAGSANDLVVGQNIMVNGSANSDGSVTAQSIQLRPAMQTTASSTNK